jgi:hypothetical protein
MPILNQTSCFSSYSLNLIVVVNVRLMKNLLLILLVVYRGPRNGIHQ